MEGWRRAVVAVAVLAAAAGCSGGGGDTAPSEPARPRAGAQDLRVAVGEDPFRRVDQPAANLGLLTTGPNPGIFETLTVMTPSFGVAPGLALRWDSPSATSWRLELREGVAFHDGRPFTADAVVAMLERAARRATRPRGLQPGGARATGPHLVEIALSEPNLRLAEQLANPNLGVPAPGTEAGAGADPASTPTGTGPFRFQSYTPATELKVVANPAWWGGPPQLGSITFRFGPPADASRLLATRQVDAVGMVPFHLLPSLSGRTDQLKMSRPGRGAHLLLNVGGIDQWATLQDDEVRRAVALAVDRRALVDAVWADLGEDTTTVAPPLALGDSARRVTALDHDPEEARRLLDEAGWRLGGDGTRARDGRRLSLTLLLARPEEAMPAAGVLKEQLAEVGVAVEVAEPGPEPASAFARVNEASFHLFLDLRYQDDANPCALCRFFSIRPGSQLSVAGAAGAGPEADRLYDQVHEVRSVEGARRVAADLLQVAAGDRVVVVPLATLRTPWLVSPRVQGFEPAALPGGQRWEQVYLSL